MLNIIKSELYKSIRRPYLFVTVGVLSVLAMYYNFMSSMNGNLLETGLQYSLLMLPIPLFFTVLFADAVVAEENKDQTLKNSMSFGINRNKFYLAKLITVEFITAVAAVIIFAFYLLSSFLFLRAGKGFSLAFFQDYLARVSVAFACYLAAASICVMFAAIIKRTSLFEAISTFVMIFPTLIFIFLEHIRGLQFFKYIGFATLFTQTSALRDMKPSQSPISLLISAAHIIVFTVIGTVLFKKREI